MCTLCKSCYCQISILIQSIFVVLNGNGFRSAPNNQGFQFPQLTWNSRWYAESPVLEHCLTIYAICQHVKVVSGSSVSAGLHQRYLKPTKCPCTSFWLVSCFVSAFFPQVFFCFLNQGSNLSPATQSTSCESYSNTYEARMILVLENSYYLQQFANESWDLTSRSNCYTCQMLILKKLPYPLWIMRWMLS
jgi:hypothetical protein